MGKIRINTDRWHIIRITRTTHSLPGLLGSLFKIGQHGYFFCWWDTSPVQIKRNRFFLEVHKIGMRHPPIKWLRWVPPRWSHPSHPQMVPSLVCPPSPCTVGPALYGYTIQGRGPEQRLEGPRRLRPVAEWQRRGRSPAGEHKSVGGGRALRCVGLGVGGSNGDGPSDGDPKKKSKKMGGNGKITHI